MAETVVTFELNAPDGEGKKRAFEVLNGLRVIDHLPNNLGDSKSLITHPRNHDPPGHGSGRSCSSGYYRRRCSVCPSGSKTRLICWLI